MRAEIQFLRHAVAKTHASVFACLRSSKRERDASRKTVDPSGALQPLQPNELPSGPPPPPPAETPAELRKLVDAFYAGSLPR